MNRSRRMASVLKLAERRERDAAIVARDSRNHLLQFEQKLNELQHFRKEYAVGAQAGSPVCNAAQLQQRQRFIQQLDEGIRVLTASIERQRGCEASDRQRWLEAYRYSNSLDKLVMSIRDLENRELDAREQQALDEHGQAGSDRRRA